MKLLALILLSLTATAWTADSNAGSDPMVRALLLIKKQNYETAYQMLEEGFGRLEPGLKRGQYALMLALANPKYIARPRYLYARVALAEANPEQDSERERLLRILGDGLFDKADVEGAKKVYEQALSLKGASPESREYVTYKLGWIYLNLHRPATAYSLWVTWLKQNESNALRRLMVKDTGRAWSEALFTKGTTAPVLDLPISKSEIDHAFEGIMAGIRREKKPSLDRIHRNVSRSPIKDELAIRFLREGSLFGGNSCATLPFIKTLFGSQDLLQDAIVKSNVHACAKNASAKQAATLAAIYQRLQFTDLDRWPKAKTLSQAGLVAEACAEYEQLISDSVQNGSNMKLIPGWIAELLTSCKKGVLPSPGLASVLFSNQRIFEARNTNPKIWDSALFALLTLPSYSETAVSNFIAASELWRHTELPAALLEFNRKQVERAERIFDAFVQKPLSGVFFSYFVARIQSLIKTKEFAEARAKLEQFFPLGSSSTLQEARLWMLLKMSSQDAVAGVDVDGVFARVLKNGKRTSLEDSKTLAYVFASRGDWNAIWTNYSSLIPAINKDHVLRQRLIDGTMADLNNLLPILEANPDSAIAKYLIGISKLIKDGHSDELRLMAPSILSRSSIAKDVALLSGIRGMENVFSALKFKVSPSLQSVLSRRISILQSKLNQARKHRWSYQVLFDAADVSLAKSVRNLSQAIATIPVEDEISKQELSQLSSVIASWRLKGGSS